MPLEQSTNFIARLRENHVPCELLIIPGAPHRLIGWEQYDPKYGDKVIAWLEHTLHVKHPNRLN